MAAEKSYYVRQDRVVSGPLPLSEIRTGLITGTIHPTIEVRSENDSEWRRLEMMVEFADLVSDPSVQSTMARSPMGLKVRTPKR